MAIYDEAVVDAQKLRQVAEEAAKQQILEAITPRIRKMINSRILSEENMEKPAPEDEDVEIGADIEPMAGSTEDDADVDVDTGSDDDDDYDLDLSSLESGDFEDVSEPAAPMRASQDYGAQPAAGKQSSIVINNTGSINIKTESQKKKEFLARVDEASKIYESRAREIPGRVEAFGGKVKKLKSILEALESSRVTPAQKRQIRDTYHKLLKEASVLRKVLVSGGGSQRLERKLISTIQEMKEMSRKTRTDIFDFLFEGEDSKRVSNRNSRRLFEADDDKTDEPADEGEGGDDSAGKPDAGAVKDALEALIASLNVDLEVTDKGAEGDESGEEKKDDADADELDLGEMGNYDEYDMEEAHDDDEEMMNYDEYDMEEAHDDEEEVVYEVSEAALRRELGKMKSLRESRARRARVLREEADAKADQFGGGEVLGDVFYDIDEDDLINVLADELGSVKSMPKPKANESVAARRAMQEAAQYKAAAENLKTQLVEMNLFNAKLLYANKLMQNKDLTLKQQKAIVEALDNAKTLNEAKLLYKSLSESLTRRGQTAGNLSESATRTLGSSSRSTRSAQPANSGVEVDRWAVLAGISKEK